MPAVCWTHNRGRKLLIEMKATEEMIADKTETQVAEMIAREGDVLRVVECEEIRPGRYRYLIETPFLTFPRFVIGQTNSDLSDVRVRLKCGAEWNAVQRWQEGVGR
jgi:hypothetical protein